MNLQGIYVLKRVSEWYIVNDLHVLPYRRGYDFTLLENVRSYPLLMGAMELSKL